MGDVFFSCGASFERGEDAALEVYDTLVMTIADLEDDVHRLKNQVKQLKNEIHYMKSLKRMEFRNINDRQ